jgi:hypothetical protein
MKHDASSAEAFASAAACLAQVHGKEAAEAKQDFGRAMVAVIGARNGLLRTPPGRADRSQLDRVNALLSLMASIEFPLAGFHSDRLELVARELDALREGAAAG